jgi:hypothetical protein
MEGSDDVVAYRKEDHRADCEEQRERTYVLGPVALRCEQDPAAYNRERPHDEQRPHRLAEENERDCDRDERRRTDRYRGPRGTGLAHREREHDLRAAGREEPRQEELPGAMEIVLGKCCNDRNPCPPRQHRERRARSTASGEAKADRHRHRAEGGGGDEAEQDDRQASEGRRTSRTSVWAAAGSARTIPAMITAQPPQPSAPSRSPARV